MWYTCTHFESNVHSKICRETARPLAHARTALRHLLTTLRATLYFRLAVTITWIFKIALLISSRLQAEARELRIMHDLFSSRLLSYSRDVVIVLWLVLISFDFYDISYSVSRFRHVSRNANYKLALRAFAQRHSRKPRTIVGRNFFGRPTGKSLRHKFIKATLRRCRALQRRSNSGHIRPRGWAKSSFHAACPARQLIPPWYL